MKEGKREIQFTVGGDFDKVSLVPKDLFCFFSPDPHRAESIFERKEADFRGKGRAVKGDNHGTVCGVEKRMHST
jgi:hypothetical protein